ncbi:unnamed protein product [Malus baccata var. baccata]
MSLNDGKVHPTSCNCDMEKDNPFKIFMGYDSCEDIAYENDLYWREREQVESTDFSFTTFFTPHLENYEGWAVFVDCDFLYLVDIKELRDLTDDKYAIMCVQHEYTPKETTKMDGAVQTVYPRKNWSSMVLYNCRHPKNKVLTPEVVNAQTDAFLHRFQWLEDEEIKSIPFTWNFLEGHNQIVENDPETFPKAIHYTRGGSWFEAWKGCEFADLWLNEMEKVPNYYNNLENEEFQNRNALPDPRRPLAHFRLQPINNAPSAEDSTCKQTYKFLPCITTVIGNLSLPNILVFSFEGSGDPCFKLWLTSTLHHVAFWLSCWQLLSGLSLEPVRASSPAHVGPPHLGSLTLSESQSIGQ